jgi:hypothetical protein
MLGNDPMRDDGRKTAEDFNIETAGSKYLSDS